jgi:hypothetical protein
VVLFVRICNTETAVPPEASKTVDGERMMVGPSGTVGVIEPVIEMVPLKPFMLERVALTSPREPRRIVREFGIATILKSGTMAWNIVSVRVAFWVRAPPADGAVPAIMGEYVLGTALLPAFTETCDVEVPPGERFTWEGAITIPTFNGMFRAAMLTCPVNPFRLVRVTMEVPEEPVPTVKVLGDRDMLKLG